jgi:CheY-like chemotaxis protein
MMPTGKKIMLVDDDVVTNMVNTRLINKHSNCIVESYALSMQALEYLKIKSRSASEDLPQIILLDINMPAMDGWEFLEEFQKLPSHFTDSCDVLILSSSVDRDDVAKSKTYSVVKDFLCKPLTLEAIRGFASPGS